MRLAVFCRLRRDRTPLGTGKSRLQRIGNFRSDVAFNSENIGQLAIVSFRPKMRIALGIDQLNVDAHLVAGFPHTALQNIRDAKLLGDLRIIPVRILESLRRCAGDNLQVANPRESGQDFLLNAAGEIGIVWIGAEIFKWQNGNRFTQYWLWRRGRFWSLS